MVTIPTKNWDIAKEAARDHYLGMMLIIKADQKHYGLITSSTIRIFKAIQSTANKPIKCWWTMSPLIIYPPSMRMMEEEFHIYNMMMIRRLMMSVVTLVALDEVVAEAVLMAVVVVVQVVDTLVKLVVISPKPYLMIVKCQNPILCLLSMTCEMGNCSSRKKDQRHYQRHGCSLIVVLQSISYCPQAYYMGYIKLSTPYGFAAMLG